MPEVEGAGVALHYDERGDGPALLVVHGMASDAAAWADAIGELAAAGARAIAYDRRGYGSSGAPQPYAATTIQEQAEDAAAILIALDASPAVLVGDGLGALVVLELLVRRPQLAAAAVLADPPLLAFVPSATQALADERTLLEQALRDGRPGEAIHAWIAARPDIVRPALASHSPLGFFADYAGQLSWSPSRRELRAVQAPVAIVSGPASPAHLVAAADAAAKLVPDVRRATDGDVVAAALTLLG
jgi:pimeloyl-ACP methyl ester carboxylesterase